MAIREKDIKELRKTITQESNYRNIAACYVDENKNVVLKFAGPFCDLEERRQLRYLPLAKKIYSTDIDKSLLEVSFLSNSTASKAKNLFDKLLDSNNLSNYTYADRFFDMVIEHLELGETEKYLIVLLDASYDVPKVDSAGVATGDILETYDYLVCAICKVEKGKDALGYLEPTNEIGVPEPNWLVKNPFIGFIYPAFISRSSDPSTLMYYAKKGTYPVFMQQVLGVEPRLSGFEEREYFQDTILDAFASDEGGDESLAEVLSILHEKYGDASGKLSPEMLSDVLDEAKIDYKKKQEILRTFDSRFEDNPLISNILSGSASGSDVEDHEHMIDKINNDHPKEVWLSESDISDVSFRQIDGERYVLLKLGENDNYVMINGEEYDLDDLKS